VARILLVLFRRPALRSGPVGVEGCLWGREYVLINQSAQFLELAGCGDVAVAGIVPGVGMIG